MPGSDDLKFGLKLTLEDGVSGPAAKVSDELKRMYEEAERNAAAFKDLKAGSHITVEEFLKLKSASEQVVEVQRRLTEETKELKEAEKQAKEEAKEQREELKRLGKEAKEAEERINGLSRGLNEAGTGLLWLGGIIEGVFVVAATKGLGLLMDEEKTLAGLTGWLGDAEKAYETLGETRDFAFTAGLSEAEVTGGDPLLLAMGISPENIARTRMVISDLARSMGKDYSDALQSVMSGTTGYYRPLRYTFGIDLKAEDFEEAGRFAGMTVVDALEQVFRERGKEVGELTEDFADTMTAQLARVQNRFDEVLREGTRALFEAIGDDLNSLLDWFEEAAASGELQEMIQGLAAGFEVLFEVVHNLLGVFTGLMDLFGAENIAKIAAFVAKWALFTGVATKVASGIISIVGAVQKAGGVLAWFAANPATAWIAAIGTAIGVIMLLSEALTPEPIDEFAEHFGKAIDEIKEGEARVADLKDQLAAAALEQEELTKKLAAAVAMGDPVAASYRTQLTQLDLLTDGIERNIESQQTMMRLQAMQAGTDLIIAAGRYKTELASQELLDRLINQLIAGDKAGAQATARLLGYINVSEGARDVPFEQILGGYGPYSLMSDEERMAYALKEAGEAYKQDITIGEEVAKAQAILGAGGYEVLPEGLQAGVLGTGLFVEPPMDMGTITAIADITKRDGDGGDGGGPAAEAAAAVPPPRLAYAGVEYAPSTTGRMKFGGDRAKFGGGETKVFLTQIFNVPVDETMAKYVGEIALNKIKGLVDKAKVM